MLVLNWLGNKADNAAAMVCAVGVGEEGKRWWSQTAGKSKAGRFDSDAASGILDFFKTVVSKLERRHIACGEQAGPKGWVLP